MSQIFFLSQATQKYVLWGFCIYGSSVFSVNPPTLKFSTWSEKVLDILEYLRVFILNQISRQVFLSVMKVSSRQEKKWLKVQINYSPLISGDSAFPGKSPNVICSASPTMKK